MDSSMIVKDETSNELEMVEECDDICGINKNVEPSDEEIAASVGSSEEPEPYVGMKFKSVDDAKNYYYMYATRHGFTVRVNRSRRSRLDKAIIGYDYVCSKEGFRPKKCLREGSSIRFSKETRIGCKAILIIAYRRDERVWVVTHFVREHNHELTGPSEVPSRLSDKALNEDEKDKRIRELTSQLNSERKKFDRRIAAYEQRCTEYKMHLNNILKDIEIYSEHLTKTVQGVIQSIKEIEKKELDIRS